MPHATMKLLPGVDTNKTPTLNEAAVSYTNLVRFIPDRNGYGLVQKLGGWNRYVSGSFSNSIRELKAWSDLQFTKYLAIGGEGTVGAQVYNPSDSSLVNVTPQYISEDITSSYIATSSTVLPKISQHDQVIVASTENLAGTYNNGTSGVGATLTNSDGLGPIVVDGLAISSITRTSNVVTLVTSANHNFSVGTNISIIGVSNSSFIGTFSVTSVPNFTTIIYSQTASDATSSGGKVGVGLVVNNRVLLKNQTSAAQNGVYVVSTVGSISVPWVLTRATDFDAWATNKIEQGALFYVASGPVNATKTFYCSNSSTVTVGSTAITFVLAAGLVTDNSPYSNTVFLYTTNVPSPASYVYFPTIINLGNVNLTGPYDIVSTGSGYFTFYVSNLSVPISKIVSVSSAPNRTVTIHFSQPHTFYAGQSINVAGVNDLSFNGQFTIGTGPNDVTTYTISYLQTGITTATSTYGGSVNANINFGGIPPKFKTYANSTKVTVYLTNHGFSVGDTFNVPVPTVVDGVTISGLYTVSNADLPDSFEINVDRTATSEVIAYENNGAINVYDFVSSVSSNQSANYFYGGGIYGEGIYGNGFVPAFDSGIPITAVDWTFDNWGSILVGCPKNGALYYWQPIGSSVQNLGYMPNSPVYNTGAFVSMPQRQIIAYGSSFGTIQDPLLVRWCDLEDFTVWNGTANNQAGSYRIPTGSRIVGGIQAAQQTLLWTDLDLWSMTYIGQPYIYGFNKIGANAGLISQKAASQMGGIVYWMSQKQFFKLSGNGVEVIPCPIWDQVFQNFYPGNDANGNPYTDRIRCASNSQFNEITWYFPAHKTNNIDPATGLGYGNDNQLGTGEVNAYVKYNVALNQWDYGYQHPDEASVLVGRTAWIDQSVLGPPIGAAAATSVAGQTTGFYIYQHETSNDADGAAMDSGFTTGYAALSDGDQMMFVDQVWPDMKWGFVDKTKNAIVKITFYVTNYPGDPPIQYGPYETTQTTQYLSVRMRGRLVAMSVSSTDNGSFWRIGAIRYRFQQDGKY